MKTKLNNFINSNLFGSIFITLSLIITVVISLQSTDIKAITQHEIITQINESTAVNTTQTYTLTKVTDNNGNKEYYGQSTSSNEGVFFTGDYLQSTGETKAGDTVEVTYDQDGEIISVSRIAALTQACELTSEEETCVIESAL